MNLKLKQFIDVYVGKVLLLINLVLVRGLGLILNRNHTIDKKAPKHILVVKILGLGSVIMASDALYSLRKKYPETKFILLCGKGVELGIKPTQLFDEIWVINDSNLFTLITSGYKSLFKSWQLKKLWVVDLEVYSVLTTIFSAWTLAINRFGFQLDKTYFRNYLNTHNVYFNQFVRVGINYQNLVDKMGVSSFFNFSFPKEYSLPHEKTYVAINNTCSELGGNLRQLPDELLVQICKHIMQTTPYKIALVGAPSDKQDIDGFIARNMFDPDTVFNYAGALNFSDYYRFIGSDCKAMLSIDSAPLHIAQKLNVPVFSFWGPISPVQRLTDLTNTYYLKKDCSPCIHHTEVIPCGGNNVCMKDMKLEDIKHQLNQLLK